MCHGHVDVKTLEREAMERLRAARPVAVAETAVGDGPPPELTGGLAGVVARLRMAFRVGRTAGA